MRLKNKECVSLSVFWYIFNSTVGLHVSSADSDILYRGNQASYKISWKTQPKLWQKCTRTSESVMRPVSKHKRVLNMLDTTEAAITEAKVFHESFEVAAPCTKPQTPLTTSHSIFKSCAAAKKPEVEKWKKKTNTNWNGFKQWYYREIITIHLSRRGFVFLQINLFIFLLPPYFFKECCFFLQVYKLAPPFLVSIMSRAGYLFGQKRYIKE